MTDDVSNMTGEQKAALIIEMRAAGKGYRQIEQALHCSHRTINRALDGYVFKGRKQTRIEVPVDFVAVACTKTIAGTARHFGIHEATARRWGIMLGVTFKPAVLELPADFEINYRRLPSCKLPAIYGVSPRTCKRWERMMPADAVAQHNAAARAAISRAATMHHASRRAAKPAKVKRSPGRGVTWGCAKAVPIPEAKADIISMAMRHLMPIYRPVCRAETIAGKAASGLFKVGRMVLSEAELLALAAKRGFAPVVGFPG